MKFGSLAALAATISSPAFAGTPLWQNLQTGMTKAEVKAALPDRIVHLTEGCSVYVVPQYEGGRLYGIDLNPTGGMSGNCGAIVQDSLITKYGQPPRTQQKTEEHDCGSPYVSGTLRKLYELCVATGGEHTDHLILREWIQAGVQIVLEMNEDDGAKFTVFYREINKGSAEAAGKL